jgi:hypothetical protein
MPTPHLATLAYTTTPKHVIQEVCLVVVTVPIMLGLGGFCSLLWYYLATPSMPESESAFHLAHRVLLACLPTGLAATLVFIWMKQRLKFTLHIGPAFLVLGRGAFREVVPCAAVESIRERLDLLGGEKQYWIELHAKGIHWKCFLGPATSDALADLQNVCRNAVLIDHFRNEHLPRNTLEPVRAIRNLILTRYRVAIGASVVSLLCLLWGLPIVVMITLVVLKRKFEWSADSAQACYLATLLTVTGIVNLWLACTNFRKAARLRHAMQSHLTPSVTAANPTRDGPSGYAASPSVGASGGFRFQGSVGPPACSRMGNRNETS